MKSIEELEIVSVDIRSLDIYRIKINLKTFIFINYDEKIGLSDNILSGLCKNNPNI